MELWEIEKELQAYPGPLLESYERSKGLMAQTLSHPEMVLWAREGLEMSGQGHRAWEAASEYFRASPRVLSLLSFADFLQWSRWGTILCADSPTVAEAYFKASSRTLPYLKPELIGEWAELSRKLCKGSWKSIILACRFFETSPDLLSCLSFLQMKRLIELVEGLAQRSQELALESFALAQEVFRRVEERETLLGLLLTVGSRDWREVNSCLEAAARVLPKVSPEPGRRLLALTQHFAESGWGNVSSFLVYGAQALEMMETRRGSDGQELLSLAEVLLNLYPPALVEFFKSCPVLLKRLGPAELKEWFTRGAALLQENREGGIAYFKLESATALKALDLLSSGVELEGVKDILQLYCRALTGEPVEVAAAASGGEENRGWVAQERPLLNQGGKVFLPPLVDLYPSKEENFQWYKVVSTHQSAHLEFGSFRFDFHRPSVFFKDLRPRLAQALGEGHGLSHLQLFFSLFEDRRLALDIFSVLEDGRLDCRVKHEYRGLRSFYRQVQEDTLRRRPDIRILPLREALLEIMVRVGLQPGERGKEALGPTPVPRDFLKQARALARLARSLLSPQAQVEDSAEATLRAYAILSQIPNQEVPPQDWVMADLEEGQEQAEAMEELLGNMSPSPRSLSERRGKEQPYHSPREVEYRDDFKAELERMSSEAQLGDSQARLQELLTATLSQGSEKEEKQATLAFPWNRTFTSQGRVKPEHPQYGYGPSILPSPGEGPLEAREPHSFLYDEWDYRAGDYKPRWCLVREKGLGEGETRFYTDTLAQYSALVSQIRRQFEMVAPKALHKVRRVEDGEDLELDAVIEAVVDRHMGDTPSNKVYWKRNKVRRDVAVVFLLDMSASTAEAIEEARPLSEPRDIPTDPVEYMIWLRNRRGQGPYRGYKRIIDLEKESLVLMIEALETIGDMYGIYGFSGYGRENVEFYIIKGLTESFSERVKGRIARITPLHATRMGPAIRHATYKLEQQEAKTRFLFLISDGRPQDRGYSREGVEREYAIHDTKMALNEAQRKGIIPFCLTVDKAGHDYLKAMCGDIGYEVLADIQSLPKRLPQLYRKLTV